MERRNQLLLKVWSQVNQQVSARDQVEPRERWVANQVVLREQAYLPDFLGRGEPLSLIDEEPLQAFGRQFLRDTRRIGALPGGVQSLLVDVGGEDLDFDSLLQPLHLFAKKHGQRIGLFAGGTAWYPGPDRVFLSPVLKDFTDYLLLECLERRGIAKEAGHADEQLAEKILDFPGVLLKPGNITGCGTDSQDLHSPADTAYERARLVMLEVMFGFPFEDLADCSQGAADLLANGFAVVPSEQTMDMRGVGDNLACHLLRGQDAIRNPDRCPVARHAVVACGTGLLNDGHAAVVADRLESQCAIGSTSGQNDSDRAGLPFLGQRVKERVDHAPSLFRRCCLRHLKDAPTQPYDRVAGSDVNTIGGQSYAVGCFLSRDLA